MAESLVQVTEGTGKKLHTFQRTIGANAVEDEIVILGEPYLASYVSDSDQAVSIATVDSHPMQLMATSTLNLYVTRIEVWQQVAVTTAAIARFRICRLTTAGTGGTAIGTNALDTTDAAIGNLGMMLPSAKGAEGATIWHGTRLLYQTAPTAGADTKIIDISFFKDFSKSLRVPAGTANGIALKNVTAQAGGSITWRVTFNVATW